MFYLLDDDQFTVSLTDDRAKVRNLRRDPRAALFIPSADVFTWAAFDARCALSDVATDPGDEVVDRLVEYYRRGNGEHPNWTEYRHAMVDERRLLGTFTATAATGLLPA